MGWRIYVSIELPTAKNGESGENYLGEIPKGENTKLVSRNRAKDFQSYDVVEKACAALFSKYPNSTFLVHFDDEDGTPLLLKYINPPKQKVNEEIIAYAMAHKN